MLKLRVRSVTHEAEGILSYELVDPANRALPRFEAGAHIDVKIPGGLSRRYSLCNSPTDVDCYRIAVLNAPGGRGGSKAMHEKVHAGDWIEVSEPHNFFAIQSGARHSVLLAGGIGITPILAMMETLAARGESFEMHYCTRDEDRTAFRRRLDGASSSERVTVHHDGGDPAKGLDIASLLARHEDGKHVYFCGPGGFMSAIRDATAHWPNDAVHFEYFGAEPPKASAAALSAGASELHLTRSNKVVPIEAGQTMLDALRNAGITCESSCEAGVCGACKTAYSAGTPEHNDYLLGDEERASQVLLCCARVAQGPMALEI
ncbi:PDR/VanB family oxidoreductase [Diaphorobacter caeni]|uniref:PDR/VanB family oxidoreductase n=1 Tax=Diaphorobacter caeni TaxID=2784387 RepID=UPI00188E63E9|nr:PDR/VanB family oxidoreductase [Diaphorobacter caeni]MBF5007321.1 oxidoreductase [Diaphorobacter caeni]